VLVIYKEGVGFSTKYLAGDSFIGGVGGRECAAPGSRRGVALHLMQQSLRPLKQLLLAALRDRPCHVAAHVVRRRPVHADLP
jgi:hypothetical protein